MAVKKIIQYPDPILRENSDPASGVGERERSVIADLVDTMRSSPGVGLAAPQIGELVRIIVVDVTPKSAGLGLIALVNPVVTATDGTKCVREGCLSIPEYTADIERAEAVTIKGLNELGEDLTIKSSGFEAVALEHEIDHLDGVLFIDRIKSIKSLYKRRLKGGAR